MDATKTKPFNIDKKLVYDAYKAVKASGVTNLESPGVEVPGWRPRHEKRYQQA